jgi:hypothetical protein
MRDQLETNRTKRFRIASLLMGYAANVRDAGVIASVNSQLAGLTAIDPATFANFPDCIATDSVSVASGAANVTSPDNPWTLADVGKRIDIAGAGAAGATMSTTIVAFISAGSITIAENAQTTVAADKNSAEGLAGWGNYGFNARPEIQRDADEINVKDYGATGDGATDDSAAFVKAYEVCRPNGTIVVPPGKYSVGSLTGAKNVLWRTAGAFDSSGSALLYLPGQVESTPTPGYLQLRKLHAGPHDFADLNIERFADYTGGTPYYTNEALRVKTIVQPGATSFEWNILGWLENRSNAVDGAQNCASYFVAHKYGTGDTFAVLCDFADHTANPTRSSVCRETDFRCIGGDASPSRVIDHIFTDTLDGNPTTIDKGIWFDLSDKVTLNKAINFSKNGTGAFGYFMWSTNQVAWKSNGYLTIAGADETANAAFAVSKASTDALPLFLGKTDGVKQAQIEQNGDYYLCGKKNIAATAAPVAGTWAVGDKAWNTAPSNAAGQPAGWICVVAGSPGTWRAFGVTV